MKVALLILVLGTIALQSINAQCLYSGVGVAPAVVSSPVVTSNVVATTLADTLSLLTVSSLLSEKLPFGCPVCAPMGPITTVAPIVGNCGCGCGGYGHPYGTYVI